MFLGNIPVPYPDENCYSILCRMAVRRGQMTSSKVCEDLFGHTQPLAGYLFKPFRLDDLKRWYGSEDLCGIGYGHHHSCYPYYTMFLGPPHAARVIKSSIGAVMTAGQAKRINRECGFTRFHKKNLWYCPECVREDFQKYGETCWRRMPQMPGVICCLRHGVRLRESGVRVSETNYRIIPATYALIHYPEPEAESGNVYAERYRQLAGDIAWLLGNGYELNDSDWVRKRFLEQAGRPILENLYYKSLEDAGTGNRFEDYLAAKILNDSGKKRIDPALSRQIGTVLSIEKQFGSIEAFWLSV